MSVLLFEKLILNYFNTNDIYCQPEMNDFVKILFVLGIMKEKLGEKDV